MVAERAARVSLVEDRVRDWATASLRFCGMIFTERLWCQYGVTCIEDYRRWGSGIAQHYVELECWVSAGQS